MRPKRHEAMQVGHSRAAVPSNSHTCSPTLDGPQMGSTSGCLCSQEGIPSPPCPPWSSSSSAHHYPEFATLGWNGAQQQPEPPSKPLGKHRLLLPQDLRPGAGPEPSMQSTPSENGHPYHPPSPLHDKHEPESEDGHQGGFPSVSGDEGDQDDEQYEMMETTRNGKRKRPISVSCELCKQRKVKCDRGQPSCGWCERNSVHCEYRERKKPGLRAGYGRELEQRLDKLEEVLRSHSDILQKGFFANGSQRPPSVPSVRDSRPSLPSLLSDHGDSPRDATPLFRNNEPLRASPAETALFIQRQPTFPAASHPMNYSMSAPISSLHSVHGGFQPRMRLASPSRPMSSNSAPLDLYENGPPLAPFGVNGAQKQNQISLDPDFPPYDLLYALVDLYFKHINPWCPMLHRKTTLDSLFGPPVSTLDEGDRMLLHAIVATTLRYSTDARLTEDRRQHFHDVSKQKVLLYGMQNSSVESLQALVILALDLLGSSNGPPGWNIMALITRSVVQLGLAVETTSVSVSPTYASIYTLRAVILPEPKDFVEDEARRRLFWMVYLLDRYATISTAFEFALDDKEIDRTLPCRDDLWIKNQKVETRWFQTPYQSPDSPDYAMNRPENLGNFSYYVEILGILSKIHKFLKKPVDISALSDVEQWQLQYKELDHVLMTWKFGLPDEYGNMSKVFKPSSAAINAGWVMLHATFHTAVIRLHSSAAYPTARSPIFTPSSSAGQRCRNAVDNIAALGEFVVGTNRHEGEKGNHGSNNGEGLLDRLGPPFAFTLWVAARLLLVHCSTVEHKLSPQIEFFVATLRAMGRHWPVATRYSGLLQRVLDEHRDSERAGDSVAPGSVQILADMRRTAFDLELLISRQPRHAGGGSGGGRAAVATAASGGGGDGGGGDVNNGRGMLTNASTSLSHDLDCLDMFNFFNMPRLTGAGDGNENGTGDRGGEDAAGAVEERAGGYHDQEGGGDDGVTAEKEAPGAAAAERGASNGEAGEFNAANFAVEAQGDWLFKASPGTA